MTHAATWSVTRLTGTFGAELTGLDLADSAAAAQIPALLAAYRVLAVRDQDLAPGAQVALARVLGEPTPAHPVLPGLPGHPEILVLDGESGGRNARWHTDVTFIARPHAAAILVADIVPEFGGDTLFADLHSAYDALSAPLRAAVDQLRAVHRIAPLAYWGEPFDTGLSRADAADLRAAADRVAPVIHPVVRVDPRTGRRGLFVNRGFTSHLVGLSRIESDGLLDLLYRHIEQPELTLRHRWRSGDVLIWDNRATSHYAVDDYGHTARRVRRVTIAGEIPVGPDGFASQVSEDPLVTVR
ncbi:TauD/TfdA dioxygenase family protein [Nocardia stercoris]|uniref:TauD/TfdA dioxygenase family protein n=1 Tax=Nocardia stercoris TaxID=2483361 RepID=UPI0018F2E037|nr:TauD/TfdA family dioxygenase [Nocardia stercoris]